jgi:hypothetical protein
MDKKLTLDSIFGGPLSRKSALLLRGTNRAVALLRFLSVTPVQRVSILAVGLSSINRAYAIASKIVLLARHLAKMTWVHTTSHATHMVNHLALLYRANVHVIRNTVRSTGLPPKEELAVAITVKKSLPNVVVPNLLPPAIKSVYLRLSIPLHSIMITG